MRVRTLGGVMPEGRSRQQLSRRRLLGLAAASTAATAVGAARPPPAAATDDRYADSPRVPFYGRHQAGVATPPPARLSFAALDLLPGARRDDLARLLRRWSAAAARMARGLSPETSSNSPGRPPPDSGEVLGMPPCRLTVTFGVGPGVFGTRLGLRAAQPPGLHPLPDLPGDDLIPARGGGDLMVQACADDAMVSYHAVRHLTRLAIGTARVRWLQQGFGAAATTTAAPQTPRNLFGLKDGTDNPTTSDRFFDDTVWVTHRDGPAWLADGSYLAVRRIRMHLERWDASSLREQEDVIGRYKNSGAPLSGGSEHTPPDFSAREVNGALVIPADAHVRLAHPANNAGIRILRRGYSFDDGWDAATGTADAGLFFLCYVRDLDRQLAPLLHRLATHDALNEYVTHTASAVFAVLPGALPGGWVGETLF